MKESVKEMKKMSNKGFTLIELLAVITIMGILMMVAIPAVTRTIENSRRDTFADTAGEYINAVRNAVLADNIECRDSSDDTVTTFRVASANPDGVYYFPICTSASRCTAVEEESTAVMSKGDIAQSTTDLMEQGGKSPFGNAEMQGYVKFVKSSEVTGEEGKGGESSKSKVVYSIVLVDSGKHGIESETINSQIKRGSVHTNLTADAVNIPSPEDSKWDATKKYVDASFAKKLEDSGKQADFAKPYVCKMS